MTTIGEWLEESGDVLAQVGIATSRLDVLVLLEDTLGRDRAQLLAHPEILLTDAQSHILQEQVRRRSRHIPLAYIRGKTEFYGREFVVNNHVLEPRPESELIIDMLKFISGSDRMVIADIGTGSGALAITAKLDLPDSEVIAIDIDRECLEIARKNARKLKADITFLQGNLAEPLYAEAIKTDIFLCNLPYVPDRFQINRAASHEPKLAIFGGPDGLKLYRRMFGQLAGSGQKPQFILTESLPPQHDQLARLAARCGYAMQAHEDFIQLFKAG